MRLSERFWQRFLGAELSPQKAGAFLESIDPFEKDPLARLEAFSEMGASERRRMESYSLPALESALDKAIARGVRVALPEDLPQFQTVSNPPPAIFVDGDMECFQAPTVAIVGTRNASTYGRAVAEKFGEALANAGVTVVSGGALGIDAAAHRGALRAGGRTVAVLAGGVDWVYPAVHGGLFTQIRERGCLVSQFAVGSKPLDYRFLMRNGLIAALSHAVIVVEAPSRSGALSTAHEAAELGREVFVVPSNIDNLNFQGSFGLIRDGATLVSHPRHVLDSLQISDSLRKTAPEQSVESSSLGEKILSVLTEKPIPAEFIGERTGLGSADILSELTILELEGKVIRDAGGYAIRP